LDIGVLRFCPAGATGLEPCTEGRPIGAFAYKLEREDGTPADPSALRTAVTTWQPGDTIPLGPDRTLQAVRVRNDDADQVPVLVVEDVA